MSTSDLAPNPFCTESHLQNSRYIVPVKGNLVGAGAPVAGLDPDAVHEAMLRTFKKKDYVCVGATAAFATDEYRIGLYPRMASPEASRGLARDLYKFIEEQTASASPFTTFLAVFAGDDDVTEEQFESMLWDQLECLDQDSSQHFKWDPEVSEKPDSEKFAFSFAGHAFFVVGMHPHASREARRFPYITLAFNLHAQFEALRDDGRFKVMQKTIRHREESKYGSINPMLADYGTGSEAAQYSGRQVGKEWKCPFHH